MLSAAVRGESLKVCVSVGRPLPSGGHGRVGLLSKSEKLATPMGTETAPGTMAKLSALSSGSPLIFF